MEVGVENAVDDAVGADVIRVLSTRANNEIQHRQILSSENRRRRALSLRLATIIGAGGSHHRDQTVEIGRSAPTKATSGESIITRGDPDSAIYSRPGRATITAGVASRPCPSPIMSFVAYGSAQ